MLGQALWKHTLRQDSHSGLFEDVVRTDVPTGVKDGSSGKGCVVEEGNTLGGGHPGVRLRRPLKLAWPLRAVPAEARGPGLWISKLTGS